jgi:hypothetical protein
MQANKKLSQSSPRRNKCETGTKEYPLSRPLSIFTLGFILGYSTPNRVQNLQDTKSLSCLPSANGGPCLSFGTINQLMQDDPDAPDLRDVPAVQDSCSRQPPFDYSSCEVKI